MPMKEQGDALMDAADRIGRVLALNTEHLSLAAIYYLLEDQCDCCVWRQDLCVTGLIVLSEVIDGDDEMPQELLALIAAAQERDCDLIWFSPGHNTVHDFPVYEWPGGSAQDGCLPEEIGALERALGCPSDEKDDPLGDSTRGQSAARKYWGADKLN